MLEHRGDDPKRMVGRNGSLAEDDGLSAGEVDHRRRGPEELTAVHQCIRSDA